VKLPKLSKKTKIAIITFLALGVTGIAVVKIKKFITKKDLKNKKGKPAKKNNAIKQIFKLPDEI
tara:strand:+ start:68 stop:259 length:192 start_codon:yes stop_codon:yes gene_type:complete